MSSEATNPNCPGCGLTLGNPLDFGRHQPQPNASESNRCSSRPRRYATLRCEFALGHECLHRAKVNGTGLHYWENDAAVV
jgi:hypothetical protein